MKRVLVGLMVLAGLAWTEEIPKEESFAKLFDGKTLNGWSAQNEEGHGWGAVWEVSDGAIDGVQEWPGSRGRLVSQNAYSDFELRLEVRSDWDWPIESGILLRLAGTAPACKVLINGWSGGEVGSVAAEKVGGLHVSARDWEKAWKKDGWNTVRIAIKGNPPEIRTWLNGQPMADFKDETEKAHFPDKGHIALTIQGGEKCFNNHIRFRNIRILELKPAAPPPGPSPIATDPAGE